MSDDFAGLAFPPPLAPMLAKAMPTLPQPDSVEGGWLYEPKWDGFRCVIFRDGDQVELFSRSQRPMARYFPELVEQVRQHLPAQCVVDGEIIMIKVPEGKKSLLRLDFDLLQQRLHPAASRVRTLAGEIPAVFVAFDLLALGGESLLEMPMSARRQRLVTVVPPATIGQVRQIVGNGPVSRLVLTPATTDPQLAQRWFTQFEGAGLDGVIAKPLAGLYTPGVRSMVKLKHARTADCVVAGYRLHKTSTPDKPLLGSLLLGLYRDGALHHVGVAASFPVKRRAELIEELEPLVVKDFSAHPWGRWAQQMQSDTSTRMPGGQSRWSAGKDLSFVPLLPQRVCEVAYDHMEGERFRHTAQFQRWRPERDPTSCTYEQLEEPTSYTLTEVLGGG